MKESQFIKNNETTWIELEQLLLQPNKNPDKLIKLFEKVSGDLAYARTFYPNRSVRLYLNNLTQKVLNTIETKQNKFSFYDIIHFYKHTLPVEIYKYRKAFITSFIVFALAVIIGVVSAANVPNFAEIVLGESYVEMTNKNINDGDPMAVYKDDDKGGMFMGITTNNIRVSFLAFILGIIGSMGTIIVLISNGIMLGTFQYFFYQKGLFLTSFLTIWIHGTIEISAIIIAGAAGIILGNGLLFPKSYARHSSLLLAAKSALRIILAIVPLFIIAGFLESFITRLTDLPTVIKALIILGSFLFIITTFIIYPWIYHKKNLTLSNDIKVEPPVITKIESAKYRYRSFSEIIAVSLAEMRQSMGGFAIHYILPSTLFLTLAYYLMIKFKILRDTGIEYGMTLYDFNTAAYIMALLLCMVFSYAYIILSMISKGIPLRIDEKLKFIKQEYLAILIPSCLLCLSLFIVPMPYFIIILILCPPQLVYIIAEEISQNGHFNMATISSAYSTSFKYWGNFIPLHIILMLSVWGLIILQKSLGLSLVTDFISWHNIFGHHIADSLLVQHLLQWLLITAIMPLAYFCYTYTYTSIQSLKNGKDLFIKFEHFGTKSKLFEQK